jgi:hypothetical protein
MTRLYHLRIRTGGCFGRNIRRSLRRFVPSRGNLGTPSHGFVAGEGGATYSGFWTPWGRHCLGSGCLCEEYGLFGC